MTITSSLNVTVDGESGVAQPGGEEDRQRPVRARRLGGAAARSADLPACRRAGGLPGGVSPGPGAEHGGDGARRGDRPSGPRRAERHHPDQRHVHPLRGGGGRVGGRHHAGHDADGGDGAAAGRVPGHGEPRAEDAADLHQGLSRHADGGGVRPGPRRDAPVLPHHRRAGRLHARSDRRPARRGAHRDGRAVGGPRACGRGDPGGRGQEQVPERRGQEQPPHRPLAGAAAGHGGRAPHHPGAEQPPHQRGPALPRGVRHRGVRRAGGLPRGCLRHGRGQRDSRRAAAAPVPQVLAARRRRPETGHRGVGPGPRHLQGDRGGPRGPDMGRERRAGPGGAVHLHDSGGPGLRYRGRPSPGAL